MDLRFVLFSWLISASNLQGKKLVTRIERFDLCQCGTGESDCNVKDFDAIFRHYDRDDSHYDITFFLKRSVRKLRMEISMERCRNKESLDNCEIYSTLKPISTCAMLAMRNTFWEATVYGMQPPYKCPLLEGVFIGRNLTLAGDNFKIFPLLNSYWRTRWTMIDDERDHVNWTLCVDGFVYKNNRM